MAKKYEVDNNTFLSIYFDNKLKIKTWKDGIKQLRTAFPKITDDWVDLLTTKMKEKEFTEKQFVDAIDNIITNCKYPTPQISDVLNYNKGIRIFTRSEYLEELKLYSSDLSNYYKAINVNDKLFYIHKDHIEQYGVDVVLWEKPATAKIHNFKPAKTEEELKQEKQPKLNLLQEYLKEYNKIYDSPDGKLLKAAIHRASMSWGNDVEEYDKAMQEVKHYERKLKLT